MTKITTFLMLVVAAAAAGCGAHAPGRASAGAAAASADPSAVASPAPVPVPSAPAAPASAVPPEPEPEPGTLGELLKAIETAYRSGDYERGLALVKRVMEMKETDVTALDRVGSVYYVLGRYGEALTIWKRALPLEKDRRRRRQLEDSIAVAGRSLGLSAEAPARARPRRRPKAGAVSPAVIDRLYKKGVKHYARGEFLQATAAFLRILELDPGNAKATKALERLRLSTDQAPPP